MKLIAPSVLSADFGHLADDIDMLNRSDADWIHVDVMDGVFVPNISFGFPVMEPLHKHGQKPLDVHLMIVHPEKYVERFCDAGAYSVGFHLEATEGAKQSADIVELIHRKGCKACVTVNPDIPAEGLLPLLDEPAERRPEMLLLMSVFAGFGGQKFIPETMSKLAFLRQEIDRRGLDTLIQIDGGVTTENAKTLFDAGADVLVAGSAVFRAKDPMEAIRLMKA